MTYRDALLRAIDGWNESPVTDEWLFEKLRGQHVNTMSAAEAFEWIDETVDVLLRQSDESTAIEVLQTVIALARQSDTTEIPPGLFAKRNTIRNQFTAFGDYARGKLGELFQHYRL